MRMTPLQSCYLGEKDVGGFERNGPRNGVPASNAGRSQLPGASGSYRAYKGRGQLNTGCCSAHIVKDGGGGAAMWGRRKGLSDLIFLFFFFFF